MPSYSDRPRRPAAGVARDAHLGSLVLAVVFQHPRQSVVALMGLTAAAAILSNALFLQSGMHPSPLFANKPKVVTMPEAPVAISQALPRPRLVETAPTPVAPAPIALPVARPAVANAPRTRETQITRNDPIAELISLPSQTVPPQAAAAPVAAAAPNGGSNRLMSVQRALAELGYGQVKPTGTMGPDTQAAIERFERDRKLPVTGQLSERTLKELAAFSGRPLDR